MADIERWEPDEHLIACARSGGKRMADLDAPDRSWVVAGLTLQGLTADETADLLGCSLRLVRSVRADPMTLVCTRLMEESEHFSHELRLAQSERRAALRDLASMTSDRDRIKAQLDRVIDARIVGERVDVCSTGDHLMTPDNVYKHRGRRWCRACARERQRRRRDLQRTNDGVTP